MARGSALAALRIARAIFLLGPQKHRLGGNFRIYRIESFKGINSARIIVQFVFVARTGWPAAEFTFLSQLKQAIHVIRIILMRAIEITGCYGLGPKIT